jgi:predicted transcriptional regulator of viral defense system
MSSAKLIDYVYDLQSKGRYSFTTHDLAKVNTHRSAIAERAALRRLKQNQHVVSPRRGFFVVLRPEYRSQGCPPANWFIDDLMRYLEQPYYVSLLSAAALHGAAHQQPMTFQVMTDRPTRPINLGAVAISFHMARNVAQMPTEKIQTETGYMNVATPEVAAFDIVRYPEAAGHLNNVATVLTELAEKIRPTQLVTVAPLYAVPYVQRLGYILEKIVGANELVYPLLEYYRQLRRRPILLNPEGTVMKLNPDKNWSVIPNDIVEADI